MPQVRQLVRRLSKRLTFVCRFLVISTLSDLGTTRGNHRLARLSPPSRFAVARTVEECEHKIYNRISLRGSGRGTASYPLNSTTFTGCRRQGVAF